MPQKGGLFSDLTWLCTTTGPLGRIGPWGFDGLRRGGYARLVDTTQGLSTARHHGRGVIDLTLVNSMHPRTIDTDMGDQVLAIRARNLGTNDLEPARQQTLNRIPIGRMGAVSDIAKGIVFLASDDACFMTGAGLVVDGGITAQ